MTESITRQQLTDKLKENQAHLFGSTLNNTNTIKDIVTLYTTSTSKNNFNDLLQSTTIISSLKKEMGYIHLVLLLFNLGGTKRYNIEESLLGGRKNKRRRRHSKKSKRGSNKKAKLSRKSRKVKIQF
jgi:hypothetical protein